MQSVNQAISFIFIDQIPNHIAFKEVHSVLVYKFSNFTTNETILKKDKAKFNVALREYLNTHCFFSVDELFFCTDGISYRSCKNTCSICTVNVYILCIYDLFYILPSLIHSYGSMECTHSPVFVCVRLYVCKYVRYDSLQDCLYIFIYDTS